MLPSIESDPQGNHMAKSRARIANPACESANKRVCTDGWGKNRENSDFLTWPSRALQLPAPGCPLADTCSLGTIPHQEILLFLCRDIADGKILKYLFSSGDPLPQANSVNHSDTKNIGGHLLFNCDSDSKRLTCYIYWP